MAEKELSCKSPGLKSGGWSWTLMEGFQAWGTKCSLPHLWAVEGVAPGRYLNCPQTEHTLWHLWTAWTLGSGTHPRLPRPSQPGVTTYDSSTHGIIAYQQAGDLHLGPNMLCETCSGKINFLQILVGGKDK